jgi:hypothetical protein
MPSTSEHQASPEIAVAEGGKVDDQRGAPNRHAPEEGDATHRRKRSQW